MESIIVLPLVMACSLLLWGQYTFFQAYHLTIEGTHQGAWKALDLRDSRGDHKTNANLDDIKSRIRTFDEENISVNASLTQKSIGVMDMPLIGDVVEFMNFFDLNSKGKWQCSVDTTVKPYQNNVMDFFFSFISQTPGEEASFTFEMSETILTDGWDARNPGGTTSGQVRDRVAGGWLGIAGEFLDISGFISDLLSAIGIDHPRVNLSEVPPPE